MSGNIKLVSWNVAGWRTTFDKILQRYGFEQWFERLGVDVLCLQEVKLTDAKLLEENHRFGASHTQLDCFFSQGKGGKACARG